MFFIQKKTITPHFLIISLFIEEKEKISAIELKCEQLHSQLQQQVDRNKKAQEEIEYLREQVIRL